MLVVGWFIGRRERETLIGWAIFELGGSRARMLERSSGMRRP